MIIDTHKLWEEIDKYKRDTEKQLFNSERKGKLIACGGWTLNHEIEEMRKIVSECEKLRDIFL